MACPPLPRDGVKVAITARVHVPVMSRPPPNVAVGPPVVVIGAATVSMMSDAGAAALGTVDDSELSSVELTLENEKPAPDTSGEQPMKSGIETLYCSQSSMLKLSPTAVCKHHHQVVAHFRHLLDLPGCTVCLDSMREH